MPRDTRAPDPEAVAAIRNVLTKLDPPGPLGKQYQLPYTATDEDYEHSRQTWAEAILNTLRAADPAARRAVVAELLTVEELAEACEACGWGLYGADGRTAPDLRQAAAILRALREPARP